MSAGRNIAGIGRSILPWIDGVTCVLKMFGGALVGNAFPCSGAPICMLFSKGSRYLAWFMS